MFSENYFFIDLILGRIFKLIGRWTRTYQWTCTRLFLVAKYKERHTTCPISILPVDILKYILELAGLRNRRSVPLFSVNTTDMILKASIPGELYREVLGKESIQQMQEKYGDTVSSNVFWNQAKTELNLYISSVYLMAQRYCILTDAATVYMTRFVEEMITRVLFNSKKRISYNYETKYKFLTSFLCCRLSEFQNKLFALKFVGKIFPQSNWIWNIFFFCCLFYLFSNVDPTLEIPPSIQNAKPCPLT